MVGSVLKGALVSFFPTGVAGLPAPPNVIVFQINPETIIHAWTEAHPPSDPRIRYNPLAVTGAPGESFSFTLMLDSDEQQADASTDAVGAELAAKTGVYTRLAALELLQFPTPMPPGALVIGQVSAAANATTQGTSASSNTAQSVPVSQVPIVLFVWGPQRIVPVRVTAFRTSEKLFDAALNPTHAEAEITLTLLTDDEVKAVKGPMASIADAANKYTQGLRQAQALANLAESASNILGMLPTPF